MKFNPSRRRARGQGFADPLVEFAMNFVRISGSSFVVFACALGLAFGQTPATPVTSQYATPVNPDATPEARELLKKIDQVSGHFTLTGQHNFPNHQSR
jgi:hypothetical protein